MVTGGIGNEYLKEYFLTYLELIDVNSTQFNDCGGAVVVL